MSSPVGHTLAGLAAVTIMKKQWPLGYLDWIWIIFFSNLPDVDFILAYAADVERHTFTHSIGFIAIILVIITTIMNVQPELSRKVPNRIQYLIVFPIVLITLHILLDMLAVDESFPYGVQLFWPLSDEFFISPIAILPPTWTNYTLKKMIIENSKTLFFEILIFVPIVIAAKVYAARSKRKKDCGSA